MSLQRLTKLFRTRVFTNACALLVGLIPLGAQATPYVPSRDSQVLEKLAVRAGDAEARALSRQRMALSASPNDAALAIGLAQRYFDIAVGRGDPRYVGYAQAVVSHFAGQPSPALLTMRGVLRQYRHDFAGALQDFALALAADPEYAVAHAWRGAIFLVQAQYAEARSECDALARLQRHGLAGGCLGLAQAYSGQLEAGYKTLQHALETVADPDNRLWLLTRLGEVAAWRGNSQQAQIHYQAALQLGLDDVYLMAAWSDFLLDSNRPQEVITLLNDWTAADTLLLRLAEAEALLQLPAGAQHRQVLADRFTAARARGDTTHRAEEARFELRLRKDPHTAVRLARENYAVQREPRDARVLLEAAIAANDPASAQSVRDWLRTSGFEDAKLRDLGLASGHADSTRGQPK
jgi:tetratricopeptide (TPR) repeat protein